MWPVKWKRAIALAGILPNFAKRARLYVYLHGRRHICIILIWNMRPAWGGGNISPASHVQQFAWNFLAMRAIKGSRLINFSFFMF